MPQSPLSQEFIDRLFSSAPVRTYLANHQSDIALRFDQGRQRIVIELLKKMDRGERQELVHGLLYAVITEAQNIGFPLTARHFQIVEAGAAGGSMLSSGLSIPFTVQEPSYFEKMKKEEREKEEAAKAKEHLNKWLERQRHEAERQSLAHNASTVQRTLSRKLGPDYRVSLGVVGDQPVVSIAPTSIVAEVMDALGITEPLEQRREVARAVMSAFREVLGREPEKGEVIIGDYREADISRMKMIDQSLSRDEPRRGREHGRGGMGR